MEYTADIEEEDVQPQNCFHCNSLVSWIPVSQPVDETLQCERCKQLPANLERNQAHLEQVRQLRKAGELGEHLLFCHHCQHQPCQCRRCPNCGYRNPAVYDDGCVNCSRSMKDAQLWFAVGEAIVYCDECSAPEDDCHCGEEDE